jgi:hypothetical protein
MNKSPKASNMKLYNKIKAEAKRKFKVWPSAYASGWLVKEYKRRGGKYTGKKPSKSSGLSRWYAEKWVDICSSPRRSCGRPTTSVSNWTKNYPYCRPSRRVNRSTPRTVSELSKSEIKRRCSRKRRSPLKRQYF